ncbi:MAG TPA: thioredoxin-like domain-containing protein [Chitinophagaceae bacterium]|jgi:hypothetical protein|nr:thioredoxin-like domain-containing protein [Chitinophagaceae bacterium]
MTKQMKKLFAAYHSKGFNIISISLDTDKDKWVKAIKDDKIDWTNASDLKGYNGYVASFYGLNYVPFNLLIDEHSQIIGKNVILNDLQIILRERLGKSSLQNSYRISPFLSRSSHKPLCVSR